MPNLSYSKFLLERCILKLMKSEPLLSEHWHIHYFVYIDKAFCNVSHVTFICLLHISYCQEMVTSNVLRYVQLGAYSMIKMLIQLLRMLKYVLKTSINILQCAMFVRIHSSQHPLAPALTFEQASFWWTRVIYVFENWTAIVDHIIKASGSYKSIIKCRFSTMWPCSAALLIPLSEAYLNGQLLCLSSRLFLCCQHYD